MFDLGTPPAGPGFLPEDLAIAAGHGPRSPLSGGGLPGWASLLASLFHRERPIIPPKDSCKTIKW